MRHREAGKQAIKVRDQMAGHASGPAKSRPPSRMPPLETAAQGETARAEVYRVNNHEGHKPMTLDEAILEMENDRDYLVYRDAETTACRC